MCDKPNDMASLRIMVLKAGKLIERGAILRQVLIYIELSPHDSITSYINCHGKGVCALCSVSLDSTEPKPTQWLDSFTAKLGWRPSCKVPVDRDLVVRLVM